MNKGFTDVVEDLSKVDSKLEKEFVKQQQRATKHQSQIFFGLSKLKCFYYISKLSFVKTWFFSSNLVQLTNFVIYPSSPKP